MANGIRVTGKKPFRKTRNSVVEGDLEPPYTIYLRTAYHRQLLHAFRLVAGAAEWVSCCGIRERGILAELEPKLATCLGCAVCMGCASCREGHVREETMRMGKWETLDGRKLYPFEMDNTHVVNAIKKLHRDKSHFKQSWRAWAQVLETEAQLRRLA